jgi:hypothetical protein
MSGFLGPVIVLARAIGMSAGLLALTVWALGRAEARWERRERDRMLARHDGRDERP